MNTKNMKIIMLSLLVIAFLPQLVYADWTTEQISSPYDDLFYTDVGSLFQGSNYISVIDPSRDLIDYLAFRTVQIPDNATIDNAYLELTVLGGTNASSSHEFSVYGVKAGNLANSWDPAPALGSLPYTSTNVDYDSQNMTGYYQKYNITITDIISEIYNQYSWGIGNDIGLIILGASGTPTRSFYAYEGGQAQNRQAKIYIEYTVNTTTTSYYNGYVITYTPGGGEVPLAYMGFNTTGNHFLFNNLEAGTMDIPIVLGDQYNTDPQGDYIGSAQYFNIPDDTAYNDGTWYILLSNSTVGVNLWKSEDDGQTLEFIDCVSSNANMDSFDIEITQDYILIGYEDYGTTNNIKLARYWLNNETFLDVRNVFAVNYPLKDKYGFDMDSYTNETGSYVFMTCITDQGTYRTSEGIWFYPDFSNSSYHEISGAIADMVQTRVDCSEDGDLFWGIYRGSGIWYADYIEWDDGINSFESSVSSMVFLDAGFADAFWSGGFETGANPTFYWSGRDDSNNYRLRLYSTDDYSSFDRWYFDHPSSHSWDDIRMVMFDGYSTPYIWARDNQEVLLQPFGWYKTAWNLTEYTNALMMNEPQTNIRNMFDHEDLGGSGAGGWTVTPPPGKTPPNNSCLALAVTLEDVKACIDAVAGTDPSDPDPPGSNYPPDGPGALTRFNTSFWIFIIGWVCIVAPVLRLAQGNVPVEYWYGFAILILTGVALVWSSIGI